jgi:hypothetical protein
MEFNYSIALKGLSQKKILKINKIFWIIMLNSKIIAHQNR